MNIYEAESVVQVEGWLRGDPFHAAGISVGWRIQPLAYWSAKAAGPGKKDGADYASRAVDERRRFILFRRGDEMTPILLTYSWSRLLRSVLLDRGSTWRGHRESGS